MLHDIRMRPEQLKAAGRWVEDSEDAADVMLLADDSMLLVGQGDDRAAFDLGGEPGSEEYLANAPLDRGPDRGLDLMPFQAREHEAWLGVVNELRSRGYGDINGGGKDERLHDAIARWGEELAQLRLHDPDPDHAANALRERREAWKAGSA